MGLGNAGANGGVQLSEIDTSAELRTILGDETGTGAAVFADTPTLVAPLLGTPTSGTLTNCTIPVGGVTGLGTGVGTFLATPSSVNLASAVTGETGSGALVFATSPALVTPLRTVLVEANTAGSGAPNVLTAAESDTVLTNEGVTAANYHTLPTAAAGLTFTFYCQDTDGIRIVAGTGDTIRLYNSVSVSAGYAESTTIGSVIILVAINATEWVATSIVGTWIVETS